MDKEKNNVDFEIRAAKWQYYTFLAFLILGVVLAVVIVIFCVTVDKDVGAYLALLILPAIFIILGGLGIYVYHVEKFVLKDGVFYYAKPFRKNQSVKASELVKVDIERMGLKVYNVVFFSVDAKHNYKKVMSFYDDGTAFKNGELFRALEYYNIPYDK